MEPESEIAKFYAGKKILITGVSGFIGKVLLWKLLHSCPSVDTIYILIRSKRGQNIASRTEKILKFPIFDNFRNTNPKLLEKIVAVAGDISETDLDLSEKDRQKLINEVHLVFHIAAVLNMDADLKSAVNINTVGTLRILQLCTEMKNLIAFIHTSTAYCYCDKENTTESVQAPMEDPYDVMNLTKWIYPDMAELITPTLIKPHPNTYTYTKRLAEKVVYDFYPKLPIAIVRPSIVIPSMKEPFPGWVDSLNGPVGLMIAGGKGVIRSMLCDGDTQADVIAVDRVSNCLVAAAWHVHKEPKLASAPLPVFNACASETKEVTWKDVIELGKDAIDKYPFEKVIWYPGGGMHSNEIVHYIYALLFHWIPAYFIDSIMVLIGKPRFMVNVQNKIYQGQKVLQYFTTREWHFLTDNLIRLQHSMNATDQELFPITMKNFDDRLGYMENAIKVCRHYILNEDPSSIPKCKRNMKILYAIDCFTRYVFVLLLFWLIVQLFAKVAVALELHI